MVLKFTIGGLPYREPPYDAEELAELEEIDSAPPIAIHWGARRQPERTAPPGDEPEGGKPNP